MTPDIDSHARGIPEPAPSPANAPRYFAWLYSPPHAQRKQQILLALESEIREVLKPGMEHRVAHVRMEWWRAEVERFAAGKPAHPLTRALLDAYGNASPLPNISGLVDTTIWDLASATFGTRTEVAGYCERWASAMLEPMASMPIPRESDRMPAEPIARAPTPHEPALIAGAGNTAGAHVFASALGSAIREVELLCDLAYDALAGRLRLPLDELERDGIGVESLAKPPWPAKLCALLTARHRALRVALAAGITSVPREHQPQMRGLLVWAALAHRRSLLAERALPQPTQLPRFALLKEVWAAWRAARHASRGTFALDQESTT